MWLRLCLLIRSKLQMFKNEVLRRIFGVERNSVYALNSLLHTEKLRHLESAKVFQCLSDQENYDEPSMHLKREDKKSVKNFARGGGIS